MGRTRKAVLATAAAVALVAGGAGIASATTGSGVTVAPIDSGVIGPFSVKAAGFELEQEHAKAFIVARFSIAPGGHLGWHAHPGGVIIKVDTGRMTIEHGNCTFTTYRAGTSEVERPGQVHDALNRGRSTVTGTAVYLNVPVGVKGAQRIDEPAPSCAK